MKHLTLIAAMVAVPAVAEEIPAAVSSVLFETPCADLLDIYFGDTTGPGIPEKHIALMAGLQGVAFGHAIHSGDFGRSLQMILLNFIITCSEEPGLSWFNHIDLRRN